ncbi:MAG: dipeptidase [Propionibacteriaceae bacterium]|jgi:acetylornithine deacetylase/succinyl-diaminopimelate desuccinylase-like protein|nr:dipeptidase [Propionibacteriaceae bacterium]
MSELAARIDDVLPQVMADFKTLIGIPSVSSLPYCQPDVKRTATAIVKWVRALGCRDVQIVQEGGQPAVIANFPGPKGTPTVCLYAHHDVQPIGDSSAWTTPAFEAEVRDGRLYGRGAADDKCGVMAHLAALRAFAGKPPVGVKLFIEGEEEIGSPSLPDILAKHRDALAADVFVIADSGNWDVGRPALTRTLRGMAECVVTVRTLEHGVHSGEFGGVVPDALTALCRLVATLHDETGATAVEGLHAEDGPDLDYPLDRLAHESAKLPGTQWVGQGSAVRRMWNAPSIAVLAIDATPVAQASNTLIPSARAKIGLRVAPGDDSGRALDCLVAHLKAHAPWGAEVEVADLQHGQPCVVPTDGPACQAAVAAMTEAWGVEPVFLGTGGSIPMIAEFRDRFPEAEILCCGACDPDSRIHGVDESLDLGDFRAFALAEARLLEKLAAA